MTGTRCQFVDASPFAGPGTDSAAATLFLATLGELTASPGESATANLGYCSMQRLRPRHISHRAYDATASVFARPSRMDRNPESDGHHAPHRPDPGRRRLFRTDSPWGDPGNPSRLGRRHRGRLTCGTALAGTNHADPVHDFRAPRGPSRRQYGVSDSGPRPSRRRGHSFLAVLSKPGGRESRVRRLIRSDSPPAWISRNWSLQGEIPSA